MLHHLLHRDPMLRRLILRYPLHRHPLLRRVWSFIVFFFGLDSDSPNSSQNSKHLAPSPNPSISLIISELHEYRNFLKDEIIHGKILKNYFGMPVTVDLATAYSAINAVIQSTAACILLKAVSRFPMNSEIKLLFTVHDEIIFIAPASQRTEVPQLIRSWMETTIEGIQLPIKLSIGKSWDNLTVFED